MSRLVLSTLVLLTTISTVSADIPPPPGVREHAFAEQIRKAGYPCIEPATYTYLEGKGVEEFTSQGLSATRVACKDGAAYLVAAPPRYWRNRANPASSALPIVRPMP